MLALAGSFVLLSGCSDSLAAPGIGASAQTTDALGVLPTDADVYGMTNLEAARESNALEAALGDAGLGLVNGRGSSDLDEFVRLTGFDPATDLDRIYVAGKEGDNARGAFVAYGRFDRDRIEQFITTQDEAEFEATSIDGLPVYITTDDDGHRAGFALASDEMVLAGDEQTLRGMLNRLGGARSAPSPELQALFDRVTFPDGAWFVARLDGADLDMSGSDNPSALAAQAADGFVVSMAFEADGVPVRAFLSTKPEASSDDVADVVRGSLAAARVGLKDQPAVLDVLDRVEVDSDRDGVLIEGYLTPEFFATAQQ
ncbi:hypothetical protein [Rubrivirga sp.]|uniref:hypothetical protein n=1 Tax=Rubrivirga sp. TaxID=1885344 RepID=UPI003C76CA4B